MNASAPAARQEVEVLAVVNIAMTKAGEVVFQADVPSLEVGIMMFEKAKLDFYMKWLAQAAREKANEPGLTIAPKGFDPRKVPTGDKLRVAG